MEGIKEIIKLVEEKAELERGVLDATAMLLKYKEDKTCNISVESNNYYINVLLNILNEILFDKD